MANLFGKNYLREKAQQIDTKDIQRFLDIVSTWHNDYHNGTLKTDKETSREQQYNRDFFLTILGYQEKPASPYSFEPKATTDKGQLPDAVVGYTDKSKDIKNISAVVELKGTSVPLDRPQRREGNMSPIQQGFKYKTQYRNCPFVIVSNFWEFRLYNDTQLDYEIWTLDDLVNPTDDYILFKTWFVLLSKDNFVSKQGKSITENLLSEIRVEQEEIGKKFYKVYKQVRLELLRDIYKNNHFIKIDIDTGIEKAQKVIDRIVFAAFAEDKGMLPDDTLQKVVRAAENSNFSGSLWSTFKGFFEAIDSGNDKLDIPGGYNGGLFAYDEILNSLKISDEPLKALAELGHYNFSEDLSVNILGHIFEQSISDLEEIKNKVKASQNLDTLSQSRRKKDGIFYTPDYIVRYIVDNSLGAYLREEEERLKQEFKLHGEINDKTYNRREKQAYAKYHEFLKGIKVVDPACGSGAFLVYVFDYLLEEHNRVGSILGLDKGIVSFEDVYKNILQNNIYGVDLNEESVEITKLSLWLKSAQKGKKLTALDNNIKCGNSLIDDDKVAGKKAFNWHKEFADIFEAGGFDVVVGNPPYVDSESMTKNVPEERNWLTKQYETARGNWDLYILFIEKGAGLLRNGGYSSMIIPNKVLSAPYAKKLREYIAKNYKLVGLTDVTKEGVFEVDVYPVITNIKNDKNAEKVLITEGVAEIVSKNSISYNDLPKNWALLLNGSEEALHGIEVAKLGDLFKVASAATVAEAYELKELIQEDETAMSGRIINTGTIDPYITTWGIMPMNYIKGRYKYPYVDANKLKKKEWHSVDKIIIAGMAIRIEAFYSQGSEYLPAKSTTVIYDKNNDPIKLRCILALLNSKYASFLFHQANSQLSMAGGYMNMNKNNLSALKIPTNIFDDNNLSDLASNLIKLYSTLQIKSQRFKQLTMSEYGIEKWPTKLNKWWTLDFSVFLNYLKVDISLYKKDDLLSLFEKYKAKCSAIDAEIQKTDHEIDLYVYKLYKLTPEEITIVEESTK